MIIIFMKALIEYPVISFSSLIVFGAFVGCNQQSNNVKTKGETSGRPNVLFILADDQRADALGCAGNTYIRTPNIDSLAYAGIRFRNSYVMGGHHGAISAPSRAMLLSGKFLFNVYDKLEGVSTMPLYFSSNGYITFGTGKWHNEKSAFEASFQKGQDVFLGGMSDHFNVPCRSLRPDGKLSEPENKGFSTDIFSGAAIDFINDYAKGDRSSPFFCYIAFTAPHDPYSPRGDYIGMYPDQSLPLPGNYMPLHPFQFDDLTIRDENLMPWPRPPELVRSVLSDYYALISHLDSKIGDIIRILKKNNLYDNTIIVYAADNGLAIGSHGLLGKQNLYEHSTKVPLIIKGPGVPSDTISDALVYLFDLFPTLSELCGLPVPPGIDGESLVQVFNGNSVGLRTSLFTAYRHTVRAVRTDDWKFIRYPERDYYQLFYLKDDPLELSNLAYSDLYKPRLEEMNELMKEWQIMANDTVPLSVSYKFPLKYDHTMLVRKPDIHQPEYTLEKYFSK